MAKKKQNPLSGSFRDPPKDEEAQTPDQAGQDMSPAGQTDPPAEPTPPDTPTQEQGDAAAEPTPAPGEPAADASTQGQAEQGDTAAEPIPAPGEPATDASTQEQVEQGDTAAEPTPAPGEPATDASPQEQAEQSDTTAEPTPAPGEPAADASAQEQAEQDDTAAEPTPAPGEPAADVSDQEQAEQGDAAAELTPAPGEPAADVSAQEQAEQSDTAAEPTPAPGEPTADASTQEQDRQDAAPADLPRDPSARFVNIADIKPLAGTFVQGTPREDYSELIESIKKNGLEKPIILREGFSGELQLVDGFHRCEAMKQAGFLEVRADVYDMTPLEASRYRRDHHTNPDLPIPGRLIPKEMPEDEKPAQGETETPVQDEEEFVVPKDFTLPIAKEGQREIVTTLKVADIHPFEGHPFNVLDDKDMWELRDSVKQYGVMEPVMVINRPAGGYEMVSGHRRLRACQLAGIQTIPALVRNLDRDEATIAMVDANLKREEISPMEKARAYKMKTDAMRRKVGRRSKTEATTGKKPLTADQELAKQVGESVATVQRYKQLNDLIPEMQEMVDKKQIPLITGANISRMKPEEQKELLDAIKKEDKVPTGAQAKELKKQSEEGTLTAEAIKQSVAPTKREEKPSLKITLGEEDLRPYFPDERTTVPDVKKGIFEALALRQKALARQQAQAEKGKAPKPPKQKDEGTTPATAPTSGGTGTPAPSAADGAGGSPDPPTAPDKGKKPAEPSTSGRPKTPATPAGGKKPAVSGKGKRPAASTPKKSNRGGR